MIEIVVVVVDALFVTRNNGNCSPLLLYRIAPPRLVRILVARQTTAYPETNKLRDPLSIAATHLLTHLSILQCLRTTPSKVYPCHEYFYHCDDAFLQVFISFLVMCPRYLSFLTSYN